jgi:aquaporin NIP
LARFNTIGPYLAEAIATFTLVFAGCGAVVITTKMKIPVANIPIAFSFGLAIMVMIYAVGHISGGHINPAVTLGLALTRHFPFWRVPLYWLSQLIGATIAALILRALFGDVAHLGTTLPSGSDGQSLVMEIVLTFFLVFVIMAVATDYRAVGSAAALAIGFTIMMDAMSGGPVSGASMNPARSFGPALVSNTWAHYWVYVVGPFVGGALGAFAYELARGERPKPGEPIGEAVQAAEK